MHAAYRTWQQVMAAKQAEHDRQRLVTRPGMCLLAVITMLGGPNTGVHDAALGMRLSPNLHTTGTPPAGALCWWTGGSHGYGHVAISAGAGYTWTTDILRAARIDKVAISLIHDRWGLTYRGWTDNYCGQFTVDTAATVTRPDVSLRRINAAQKVEQKAPRAVRGYPDGAVLVEKALAKIGVTTGGGANIDGHLGTGYTAAVHTFQNQHSGGGDGILGPREFALLASMSGLFDAVA